MTVLYFLLDNFCSIVQIAEMLGAVYIVCLIFQHPRSENRRP
jgi:hypothetical protein